ncbi:MAG: ABC transporter permease [Methanobacteriota archaeon]|nr:MAG: ABC transporter permease [Euryarchaeota archaeon]
MTAEGFERQTLIGQVGPYHYFYAANRSRVVVFEVTYVNSADASPRSGRVALDLNRDLAAPPFVYYNDLQTNATNFFRGGTGQTILVPLTNATVEVYDVSGQFRTSFALNLSGEPATVSGSTGWVVSADYPYYLFLPLRSASHIGLAVLDLGVTDPISGRIASPLRIFSEYVRDNPTWESEATPTCYYFTRDVYAAFYDPSDGAQGSTHIMRINATGREVTEFRAVFPGRIRGFFEVEQTLSRIFVLLDAGGIWQVRTDQFAPPEQFPVTPPSTTTLVAYAGALGGTLYGPALTPQELFGVWTDSAKGETVVFQLLGTILTPLPPGRYPSGNTYLLGTDFRGRDILTLIFFGTRVAFIVGLLAALFAVGLGTLVGLIAGYYGKIVDTLLMRTTDIFLVLPFLPIVLILSRIVGASIWNIIFVLSFLGWPGIARVIRAQVLTLRERPFIDAARVAGASDFRLVFSHIAPNVLAFSFLYMSLGVAGAIITEAALSYIGLGDITVISWGGILSDILTTGGSLAYWWWLLPPGVCITTLSLGFYLLGRGFDEIVNPRLRRR